MTHLHNPDAIADLNQFTLRKLARTLVSSQSKFAWIWIQCNTFHSMTQLSVFASVAHIPWMKRHFIGFLGVIYIDGVIESYWRTIPIGPII